MTRGQDRVVETVRQTPLKEAVTLRNSKGCKYTYTKQIN